MNRPNWQHQFKKAWQAKTILWDPNHPANPDYANDEEVDPEWAGKTDFSVVNMWVEEVGNDATYRFGAPYRKEISPDDILGSYQGQSFVMVDGIVTVVKDGYNTGGFNATVGELWRPLKVGLDVYELFPNPEEAVEAFYHETGLQY
jgi:hypothetical protein